MKLPMLFRKPDTVEEAKTLDSIRSSFNSLIEDLDTIQRINSEEKAAKAEQIKALQEEMAAHQQDIDESTVFRNNLIDLIGKKREVTSE